MGTEKINIVDKTGLRKNITDLLHALNGKTLRSAIIISEEFDEDIIVYFWGKSERAFLLMQIAQDDIVDQFRTISKHVIYGNEGD